MMMMVVVSGFWIVRAGELFGSKEGFKEGPEGVEGRHPGCEQSRPVNHAVKSRHTVITVVLGGM